MYYTLYSEIPNFDSRRFSRLRSEAPALSDWRLLPARFNTLDSDLAFRGTTSKTGSIKVYLRKQ